MYETSVMRVMGYVSNVVENDDNIGTQSSALKKPLTQLHTICC